MQLLSKSNFRIFKFIENVCKQTNKETEKMRSTFVWANVSYFVSQGRKYNVMMHRACFRLMFNNKKLELFKLSENCYGIPNKHDTVKQNNIKYNFKTNKIIDNKKKMLDVN